MRLSCLAPATLAVILVAWPVAPVSAQEIWPDQAWTRVADHEAAGWSTEGLAQARELADSLGTASYMVVENGRVVDSYGDLTHQYRTHSVRKSILSALYGIAWAQGRVPLGSTLADLGIEDYARLTEAERQATVRHLLQSRSGVYLPAAYENEAFDEVRPDRGSYGPGEHWFYSNWDFNTAGTVYQFLTGRNLFTAFREDLAEPLDMEDFELGSMEWRYDKRSWHPAYLFRMSSRDLARVGLLYLRHGRWEDRQIVPEEWVERTTRPISDVTYPDGRPLPGACFGMMWWVPCPEDPSPFGGGMFNAVGTGEQVISVLPAHDMVFVHRTNTDLPSSEYRSVSHPDVMSILRRILAAKRSPAPSQEEAGPHATPLETPSAPELPDSVVALPNPKGPYQVGTATRLLRLEAPEELTEDTTDHRQVIVQLFYPARRTRDVAPAAYLSDIETMQQGLREHGFPPFRELGKRLGRYRRVQTAAWPDEPMLSADGPFPILLFSPGANVSRHWYTGMAQELASRGYVVALMSHAHSTLDVFPDIGLLASHPYWHPGSDVPDEQRAARDSELSDRLGKDARATLNHMERLAATDSLLGFRGALDLSHVGIVGHSRGGATVTRSCATERRFRACIVLDNIGSQPEIERGLDQPQLTIRTPWPERRAERLHGFLEANRSVAFDVVIPGAKHMSFSDAPLVDREGYPPGELAPLPAHRTISGLLTGFLDRFLRDRDGAFRSVLAELENVELTEFGSQ